MRQLCEPLLTHCASHQSADFQLLLLLTLLLHRSLLHSLDQPYSRRSSAPFCQLGDCGQAAAAAAGGRSAPRGARGAAAPSPPLLLLCCPPLLCCNLQLMVQQSSCFQLTKPCICCWPPHVQCSMWKVLLLVLYASTPSLLNFATSLLFALPN